MKVFVILLVVTLGAKFMLEVTYKKFRYIFEKKQISENNVIHVKAACVVY